MKPSIVYGFVRSRQLEGTYPGKPGTGLWVSTSLRVRKGWGFVEENDWPYPLKGDPWPPIEPPGLDEKAKKNGRLLAYMRIRSYDDCVALLRTNKNGIFNLSGVLVAFQIDSTWNNTKGIIPKPDGRPITDSHLVVIERYFEGIDHPLYFWNSWGAKWGCNGYGFLPREYFLSRLLEAWIMIPADILPPVAYSSATTLRIWEIEEPLGGTLHGMEIFDGTADEIIGWAFAVERQTLAFLDIEELFVRPDWRRHGYASQLTSELMRLAERRGRKLRAWIPHSDYGTQNIASVRAIMRKLRLGVIRSSVRWAAAVAR